MTNQLKRGALIVLEGLDRSGKTTQSGKLLKYLEDSGRKARIQRFPDRDEPCTGKVIDEFLRTAKDVQDSRELIHLLFAANRWSVASKIREDLNAGITIIVDRYSFSGVTYSMAKGLEKQWTCMTEVGLPRPDLVLFFDVDAEKTAQRGGYGDEAFERSDFQKLIYENWKKIFYDKYWKKINASDTIENVYTNVVNEIENLLKNYDSQNPIENLTLSDFSL